MPDGALLIDSLNFYIGRTVTIFTTSGGLSGSGFTGVLAAVNATTIKLITDIGAAPACPIGSTCGYPGGGYGGGCCSGGFGGGYGGGFGGGFGGGYGGGFGGGFGGGYGGGYGGGFGGGYGGGYGGGFGSGYNWLGSVTEIPIVNIASFTHNAI